MPEMTNCEIRNFLLKENFTDKLGTVNKKKTPHKVTIWYILNKENNIIFNTGKNSIRAKNVQRDNRVRLCVNDSDSTLFMCYY